MGLARDTGRTDPQQAGGQRQQPETYSMRNKGKQAGMRLAVLGLFCGALAGGAANATEGGGLPVYADGLENFMSGALPPPGVHWLSYAGALHYDKVRDASGDQIPIPGFKVNVGVIAPRLIWVTEQKVMGGQLAFHVIAPLLTVKAEAMGESQRKSGLGDIVFGPALGYHPSERLHYVLGLDVYAPTGRYRKEDSANLGRNYWAFQPVAAVTYMQPTGLNIDTKFMFDVNMENNDTDTRSGNALHVDYAVSWGWGNGLVTGVGGYWYRQLGDDHGPNAGPGKARAFAIGPSLRYANDKGFMITAKWQTEMGVRSRPEGSAFMLKASLPF